MSIEKLLITLVNNSSQKNLEPREQQVIHVQLLC